MIIRHCTLSKPLLKWLQSGLNLLFSNLPEDQIKQVSKEKTIDKRKTKEKKKFDSIDQELEEIKKKLNNLG